MRIPILHSAAAFDRLVKYIAVTTPPGVFSVDELVNAGFAASNDREMLTVLRLLGFLTDADEPTDRWLEYQHDPRLAIRRAVETCYADLLDKLPDAPLLPASELIEWFCPPLISRSRTSQERAIRTFYNLAHRAGMVVYHRMPAPLAERSAAHQPLAPSIVFALPSGETSATYEAIFRAARDAWSAPGSLEVDGRRDGPSERLHGQDRTEPAA